MNHSVKHCYEFGRFRLEPAERLLLRDGERVALRPKAFDTLLVLVRNSGHLMTKEELMTAVWPDTVVEENGLARNISDLRKVLGDDANEYRYIETVPRLGYRFVAQVREQWESAGEIGATPTPTPLSEEDTAENRGPVTAPVSPVASIKQRRMSWPIIALSSIPLALISILLWRAYEWWMSRSVGSSPQQPLMKQVTLGVTGATKPMFSPDGEFVLYVGAGDLYLQPASGGEALQLTDKIQVSGDMPVFTADGAAAVFASYRTGEDGSRLPDLWIVPRLGGTPQRYLVEATGAGFSPDGRSVAYTKHLPDKKPLWISPVDRLDEHREVSELGFTPRWSPDGKWLAYTTSNPNGGGGVLWIVSTAFSERRQITEETRQMYGLTWSADSQSLIFASGRAASFHLSQVSLADNSVKTLTVGVGDYVCPSTSRDGKTVIFAYTNQARDVVMAKNVNDANVEQVTRGEIHLWPRLSPSGERVASVVQRSEFNEYLHVTDLQSKRGRRLSDRPAYHPCWLDEDHLVYLSSGAAGQGTEARVVSLLTGVNSTWLHFASKAHWLTVHPERKKLAVVLIAQGGRQQLVLRDLERRTDTTLAEGAEYEELRWSSDGAALSWSGPMRAGGAASNGVWVVEPGRGKPRQIVRDGFGAVWSADGASVYFSRFSRAVDQSGLWRLNLRQNAETIVRSGWEVVPCHDLVGARLVFTPYSNRGQVYSMSLSE